MVTAAALKWKAVPMRRWPKEAFEQLGLLNPYEPCNLTIRRKALCSTQSINGAIVECGVFRGQTLATIAWLAQELVDHRPVFGFDSFEGFPEPSDYDKVDGAFKDVCKKAYFADTRIERVQTYFEALGLHVTLVPGFFGDSLPSAPPNAISLLILDCDLYQSYKDCLVNLYPRMQPGGWIIFDEYYSPNKYPGARIAVDEFFADKPEKPILAKHLLREHPYERWYLVKA